ncbi:SpoIIE family protein phosphatase [Nonomuraea aridisoli]|uniref:Serine/threonine protein phosphatase n=1 Tax=Nonomuraea aridisoli TaxID=2070368 RepID=A0A2W2DS38_9ACTN|nr:SpoIIE family protein phosphatase [Nonomuraea aridisoli]PZG07985.1 serine/threonine protein phosphatase [Nonomuraea aridisoli]
MKDENTRRAGDLPLSVFDPAPAGVAVFSGSEHRLIYMNDAYQEILGEHPLGTPAREVFHDITQEGYFTVLDQVRVTGKAVSLKEIPFEYRDHPLAGRKRHTSAGVSRISLENGEDGVMIMAVTVTDQVESKRLGGSVAAERDRFLQRYQRLIELEKQEIWVTDPSGDAIEPCPGWNRYTGQPWEEYRGKGWLNAVHPDDRGPTTAKWLVTVERLDDWNHVCRLKTRDGGYRHVRLRGVPIVDGGEVVEWIGTFTDVEQEWQEERRKELLDRAAAATADLGSLDEVVRTLADVIVPALADVCGIFLLPEFEGESIRPPFVAERLISVARTGMRPPVVGPQTVDEECDFVTAIRTRRPILRVFPKGKPPPGSVPPGAENYFVCAQGNSVAHVPVIVDGAVAAVVAVGRYGDRERLDPDDVDLLGRMLAHAHVHLSNAMRFQRTQRVALALQNYLLPEPPRVPGLEITARYRASVTSAEIGGDWYDSFVRPDDTTVLTIGDVAGHDLAAAVTMSQLRNMLRGLAMDRQEPPGDILRRMDVATEWLNGDDTATCILARLEGPDSGVWSLHYSVAGHPPPLLVTHEGEARFLEDAVNPLLGAGCDMPRSSSVAVLPARSTLLLYTDGLVEVPGEHLDVGLERLRRGAASLAREPLDDFCDKLLQLPMAYKDDIAMIAVRLPEV